jgi:hypothetical protein
MPHAETGSGGVRRGCLVILLVAGLAVGMDTYCQSRFDTNLPIYPGAQIVTRETPFLSLKRLVLYSEDYSVDIRTWYNVDAGLAARDNPDRWRGQLLISPARDRGQSVTSICTCPARHCDG